MPPSCPVNPSIHRHGWMSRRAFVLSNWLVGAGMCGSKSLIDHECASLTEFKIPHYKRADRLSFTAITASLIGDTVLVRRPSTMYPHLIELMIGLVLSSHKLHFPCRPCHVSPTDTTFLSRVPNWLIVMWVLSIAMQLEATVPIGYRFWKSIQRISKASVSARSRSS
ncbi:hypothetical protein EDB92DRAFT_1873809 [Lactarius akahatsu]|uniref:Uncharacterized protein n=1 Tax=Lactarius akahatsu TaxID=416441 RepID=A0AAD4LHU7_9AGAM|nr:hypothetical protein EDB92DRAFT_1873809 [Lactarius akahatsu]